MYSSAAARRFFEITEGFGRVLLPRAMATFRRDHPDVAFQLDIVDNEEVTRRVIDGDADLAVTYTTRLQHGIRVEGTAIVPVYAIAPSGHELAKHTQIGLAELCQYPLALPLVGSLRELFDLGIEIETITCHPALVCNGLGPKYEFVRGGGGLAIVGGVGDLHHDATGEGVAYVNVDHAVFRKREVQVQRMPNRILPLPTVQFIELLVRLISSPASSGAHSST